jgi:drug/metabolite transporter (DMT)-like permease
MSWQFLVGISIFLFSLDNLFHRVLMREDESDPITQTIIFYSLGGILSLCIAPLFGGFHYQISLSQLPLFALIGFFGTLAPVMGFKALKSIGASESSILSSSTRLWVVFGAFLFLHESFSIQKIIGTIIILVGIGVAQWQKEKIILNRGALYALIAALSYAIAEIISFYILRDFDTISFSVFSSFLPVVILSLTMPGKLKKLTFYKTPSRAINITIVSVIDALATIALYFAYQLGHNASQISPIMGTQTIVSVILAILILKERNNMLHKIIGATIVVLGVMLVV